MNDDASTRPRRSRRRDVVALLLSAALATCTDHSTGPAGGGRGSLAIRPTFSSPVSIASFGLTIDSLRVRVTRPVDVTVFAQTFFFDPNDDSLQLSLPVQLIASVESLAVHLEFLAGTRVLFAGTDTIVVAVGAPDTTATANVALTYVGPGAGATSIRITPRDSVVTLGGTRQFSVAADSLGTPVDSIYISWSTSNTTLVPINTAGLLQAPNARGSVFVRAVTPDSLRDSTRLTFIPIPATLTPVSGGGQSGVVATRLTLPLRVRVTASDLLGVQGIPVRFLPPVGGSVRDSVVVSDSLGFAEDSVTLGTTAGPQSFQASVTGLTPATFLATANAGTISAAQSTVTVSAGTVASGTGVTLTLRGKDQFGNNLTTGGATVAFTAAGGTSTGSIGPTTDQGDGTYTATFTGLTAGTATTIGATVNGTAVTTALPTIAVTAGTISPLTSVVSTSSGTVSSGATTTLTLQAKDSAGNSLTTGGATVVFSRTGGTSTGTIGPTTDHANGTYSAVFTADSAGAATTIRAAIGGVFAASTTTITVVPGNTTAARSVITVSDDTIPSGGTSTLTLQAKDGAGNNITTGGLTVIFSHSGGTSAGGIAPSPATDNGDGTYTATFTGQTAGTATTIGATIDGSPVTSTLPTITVTASAISPATSVVTSSDSVLPVSGVATLALVAKDAAGNAITTGGAAVVFTQSGGTSTGTISPTTDNGDGSYTATFTGLTAGTATTIGATINSAPVTSVPLPTIRVFSSVHTADITADSTWTAAASPHIVGANIRIRNGATLTIQAGATVRFDAGTGLLVGDTTLGEAGRLNIDGGALGILLTANTATPIPGFWRGIEVQRALSGPAWRKALIEYAGGSRPPFGGVLSEACVLIVNRSGAALDLDSLLIRRCVHAAIHHFGGTAHVHRSQIDTVTGSGIHVDFDAQLELDSTTIRGSGQEGLFFASLTSRLLPSSGNRVLGSSGTGIHLNAFQLPGLLKQDSIVGNGVNFGTNLIEVQGGRPDSTVAAFTIFAQPQPIGLNGYLIRQFGGLLDIGRVGGQAVTLDSNVVLRFEGQTGMRIGDSAGTRSGTIHSLGTNALNRPFLNGSAGTFPGAWVGLEIGRLSGPDTLRFIRISDAGDSIPGYTRHRAGLLVRNPVAVPFVLDRANIATSGSTGSPTNSAGIGIIGTGGTEIRNSVLFQNVGFGIAVQDKGFKIVNDTIQNHAIGIVTFMEGGTQLSAADSIAGNTFPGTQYALSLTAAALRALQFNPVTTAASDTLLFNGGLLTADATLPNFSGYVWRATRTTTIDSSATFTLAPGDTIAFDSLAGIRVGDLAPGALAADGSTGKILLTASSALPQGWFGIDWHKMQGSGSTTNNVFRHVDVDRAGFFLPCFGDCSFIPFGALRFTDSIAPTNVNLSIDNIIVRRSNAIALDFQRGGTGTVAITTSQFYLNKPDPMIRTRFNQGSRLSITGSDLYHYRGWVIQSAYRGGPQDSVNAVNNWWGDVLGPDTLSQYSDSLGRASTNQYAARIFPFATTPFFPIGPAVGVTTTRDSLLNSVPLNDSIGIYARVLDANGRGVLGQNVSWTPIPSGVSFLAPPSSSSDIGGRVNVGWKFTNTAGRMTAHATGGGGFTDYFIDVLPGASTVVNWTLLGGTFSQGTVTGPKSITFTSTERRGVIVTHSHDGFNNATQFFSSCFDVIGGNCFTFPQPGVIDSIHSSGGVDGDTIFFHAVANTPSPFVFRAFYNGVSSQIEDSVVITMNPGVAGVKIDRDEFAFNGVQTAPDTAVFTSICPAQPNSSCQREFHAFVVDSGLAPVGNQNAQFQWALLPPTGAPVTFTTRGAPANDSALVTAEAEGFARLVVQDGSANNFGADTLPILVQQVGYFILITPDSASVLIGNTTTFQATVVDGGSEPLVGETVHWRFDPGQPGKLTIVDTSVVNQVTVRMDSTPIGSTFLTGFWGRPLADTAFGYSPFDTLHSFVAVFNPVQTAIATGTNPLFAGVNDVTNRIYVTHGGDVFVSVIDGSNDAVLTTVPIGALTSWIAVNPKTNRIYVAENFGSKIWSIDGATSTVVDSGGGGVFPGGISVDTARNRIYVPGNICVLQPGPPPQVCIPTDFLSVLDGTTMALIDTVRILNQGIGTAYNPVTDRIYVVAATGPVDTVQVIDGATLAVVANIEVGASAYDVAVNPLTNRVYVTNESDPGSVSIIDGATNSVITTVFLGFSTFPEGLGVDPVTNRIYVSHAGVGVMRVIDGVTNTEIGQIFLGGISTDAQPNPVTGRFYVPVYGSSVLKSFRY